MAKEKEINLEGTGKHNGHAFVDLGLPSGLLWATCNVGATNPEDYGDYFACGETKPKDSFREGNYAYSDNQPTLPSEADAAAANWGEGWRMPTKDEMEELLGNCTSEWTVVNRVNGQLFTGPNGNSIFLPVAGFRYDSELYGAGSNGYYWLSSLYSGYTGHAWYLRFYSGRCCMYSDEGYCGFTIRAVCQSQK